MHDPEFQTVNASPGPRAEAALPAWFRAQALVLVVADPQGGQSVHPGHGLPPGTLHAVAPGARAELKIAETGGTLLGPLAGTAAGTLTRDPGGKVGAVVAKGDVAHTPRRLRVAPRAVVVEVRIPAVVLLQARVGKVFREVSLALPAHAGIAVRGDVRGAPVIHLPDARAAAVAARREDAGPAGGSAAASGDDGVRASGNTGCGGHETSAT